jgi:hypothetical protein
MKSVEKTLAHLMFEDYVRRSGIGDITLPWGDLRQRTRNYWIMTARQAVTDKARDLLAQTAPGGAGGWALLSADGLRCREEARSILRGELLESGRDRAVSDTGKAPDVRSGA